VRQLARMGPQDLGHQHLVIVVGDPTGNAAEELECPAVELPERLRARPLKRLHEERVRPGKRQHKEEPLPELPLLLHQALTHIHLGLARVMLQRNEDFLASLLQLPDLQPYLCIPARVTLLSQPLEDPLRRVPLLLRHRPVRVQHRLDPTHVRPDLRLRPRLAPPVTRRLRMLQHLLQRQPMQPRLPQHLPLTDPLPQHSLPYLLPPSHVGVHPFPPGPDGLTLSATPSPAVCIPE
jgi:hypothetical protein